MARKNYQLDKESNRHLVLQVEMLLNQTADARKNLAMACKEAGSNVHDQNLSELVKFWEGKMWAYKDVIQILKEGMN